MDILILDLTHGGDILAEEYAARGHTVTCADVYHLATEEKEKELAGLGVNVCERAVGKYDLAVMPAHCPDIFLEDVSYGSRMTFSRAVGELIRDGTFRIEVTGVKGKTSTCYLLAHILSRSGLKVFLHTSRGQGPWENGEHSVTKKMSIAPTSLLRLPEGYDCIIAEVSLGGSGRADIAAITNLTEDYGIARDTGKASYAKADILTNKTNIVLEDELRIWERYGDRRFVTCGNNVRIEGEPHLGTPLNISFDYDGLRRATLDPRYLSLQYIPAMNLALAICRSMGIPADDIVDGLETFKGVPGRGEILSHPKMLHISDRNPGISATSVRMTLSCLRDAGVTGNMFVIVDPVSRKVCDKMDSGEISKVIKEFGGEAHFTDGTGIVPEIPEGTEVLITFVKEGFQ